MARPDPTSSRVAYLVLSSPHLGDALRATRRLGSLILDSLKIELVAGQETASLTFDVGDAFLAQSHHVIAYLVMVAVRALRRAHGTDFALREVISVTRSPPVAPG